MIDGLKKGVILKPLTRKLADFPEDIVARTATDFNKAFHSKLLTLAAASESELHAFSDKFSPHYRYCFGFMNDDEGQWFLDWEGARVVREWIVREIEERGGRAVFEVYDEWKNDWTEYEQIRKKIDTTNLTELSDEDYLKLFDEFYVGYLMAGSVAYMADTFMSSGETDWLEERIGEALESVGVSESDLGENVRAVLNPLFQTYTLESEWRMAEIGRALERKYPDELPSFDDLKRDDLDIVEKLEAHSRLFFWIRNNYFNVEFLNAEHFYSEIKKRLCDLRKDASTFEEIIEARQRELDASRTKREGLFAKFDSFPNVQAFLKVSWLFAEWKDVRKSGSYIGMHYFDIFLIELSRRTGLLKYDLSFLLYQEIPDVVLKRCDLSDEISRRKRQAFFAITPAGYYIVSGPDADRYFKYLKAPGDEISGLKGVSACKGLARGSVKIIRKTEEMDLFQIGEILVTNQTTPEFVPIMKKAGAIVTEQGGVTSHAAVISRELGVPCVIGIKNATKVLKDGMTVEVDANKGVIKILPN